MKLIEWLDDEGFKHLSWVKDNEGPEQGPRGMSNDPPDLDNIDWHSIKLELHNRLVERRLTNWDKVQKEQTALSSILQGIIKRHLVTLFRSIEKEGV